MNIPIWAWLAFAAVIVVMLAVDLLAHRRAHVVSFRDAAAWSGVWVGLSLAFALVLAFTLGRGAATDFTTAWLLEKSLSVDNLFVFALIFGYFKVPRAYQHRVLFLGVVGALVLRGLFLAAGVAVIDRFTAVLFVFGAFLIYSAVKMLRSDDDEVDPGNSIAVRLLRRVMPVSDTYHGTKFVIREAGRRVATPLLAVLVAIETADLVFAVDSVPAVLAVSDNTFIVFSSNAFAILGLRSLYFLLSGMLDRFRYLGVSLSVVLAFVGVKLTLQAAHEIIDSAVPTIPSLVSLGVIVVVLTAGVTASLVSSRPESDAAPDLGSSSEEPNDLVESR
jgi:tellurite resistance protein TerC